MNTKENNKLLAEFLGLLTTNADGDIKEDLETFKFHNDWNWLMLVVDKIFNCDMYHDMYIDYDSSMFTSGGIRLTTDINNVYGSCVEFVKWYKKQNNKQGNG